MRSIRCLVTPAIALLLLAGSATSAGAAPITIGSPLSGTFTPSSVGVSATLANLTLPEPGAQAASPVEGVIVRWRLLGATGSWKLRVLHPVGGTSYQSTATSAAVTPPSLGTETFSTNLPVKVGDLIGVDSEKNSKIGAAKSGATIAGWIPGLLDGETRAYTATEPVEIAFNADVQPRPTVTSLTPASGSFKGGSAVTVAGTDFASVSAVSFGGVPATSFTVGSEGSLTAVAPAAAKPGAVDVTVTTIAGTSPSSTTDRFTYTACVVPKLAGLKLKAAKRKLKKARCALGKLTKLGGATAKSGHVSKQGPKAGRTLAPGSKVNLTLR